MPVPNQSSFTPSKHLFIRPARPTDSTAVSRICLLTADAGESAEAKHVFGELPGLTWAVSHLHMPHAGGFVLVHEGKEHVDERLRDEDGNEVVAYIVYSTNRVAFNDAEWAHWHPPLRMKYPLSLIEPSFTDSDSEDDSLASSLPPLTDKDKHYIRLLHYPEPANPICMEFSPAHMHINILPAYQRQGWGRRLMGSVVSRLRDVEGLTGIWLGRDMKNVKGANFYAKMGFRHENVAGAPKKFLGLKFEDWDDEKKSSSFLAPA